MFLVSAISPPASNDEASRLFTYGLGILRTNTVGEPVYATQNMCKGGFDRHIKGDGGNAQRKAITASPLLFFHINLDNPGTGLPITFLFFHSLKTLCKTRILALCYRVTD